MESRWQQQVQPGAALRALVREATAALIVMDAQRLEELARCCAALNNDLQGVHVHTADAAEIRCAVEDINLLGRVILETRANLIVLSRLHAIRVRECRLSHAEIANPRFPSGRSAATEEGAGYGDN